MAARLSEMLDDVKLKPRQIGRSLRRLKKVKPIRLGVLAGTVLVVVVGVVLVALAYAGNTFWLGSKVDKPTAVTVALTFDGVLFAVVAAALALAAYWQASGEPDLSAELGIRFSDKGDLMLLVSEPDELGLVYASKAPDMSGELIVRNHSQYAARNASVVMRFHGLGLRASGYDWHYTAFANTIGVTEVTWDSGDRLVHGRGVRKLPVPTFSEAFVIPRSTQAVEVTMFADGTAPRTTTFPIRLVTREEWNEIMKQRSAPAQAAARQD